MGYTEGATVMVLDAAIGAAAMSVALAKVTDAVFAASFAVFVVREGRNSYSRGRWNENVLLGVVSGPYERVCGRERVGTGWES